MPTKKTNKKPAPAAKAAPVAMAGPAGCTCGCGCRCGFWKKLLILLLVFAAGFAVAKYCFRGRGMHMGKPMMMERMFVNGCLDVSKIQNPELAQRVAAADANGDGCITKEELKAAWQNARPQTAE